MPMELHPCGYTRIVIPTRFYTIKFIYQTGTPSNSYSHKRTTVVIIAVNERTAVDEARVGGAKGGRGWDSIEW